MPTWTAKNGCTDVMWMLVDCLGTCWVLVSNVCGRAVLKLASTMSGPVWEKSRRSHTLVHLHLCLPLSLPVFLSLLPPSNALATDPRPFLVKLYVSMTESHRKRFRTVHCVAYPRSELTVLMLFLYYLFNMSGDLVVMIIFMSCHPSCPSHKTPI